jgi:hypothetical protein
VSLPHFTLHYSNGRFPTPNSTTTRLLTLVDGLQKDPLTDNQQVLLSELEQRLAALAVAMPGTETMLNKPVVNEQAIPVP